MQKEKIRPLNTFDSAVRSSGDQAGVFEYDGDAAYFYLYDTKKRENRKVIAAIRILTGAPDFGGKDITIRWDSTEDKVGLFIRQRLWAVFASSTGAKYGGNYRANVEPVIPIEIANAFLTPR